MVRLELANMTQQQLVSSCGNKSTGVTMRTSKDSYEEDNDEESDHEGIDGDQFLSTVRQPSRRHRHLNPPPKLHWDSLQGRLFGREKQQAALVDAYQRICSRSHERMEEKGIVIITGLSGTGKTALASQTLKSVVERDGGYFLCGKNDQIQRQEPYAPFVAAFEQFVDTILAQDDTIARRRIQLAIAEATEDSDEKLLTDMIPPLGTLLHGNTNNSRRSLLLDATERISHSGNDEMMMGSSNSNKRNHNFMESPGVVLFCKFMYLLCCSDNAPPLVLLLDDLQWIDSSSLALLKALASNDLAGGSGSSCSATRMTTNSGLMIVCTCRWDEVSINHPVSACLRYLEEEQHVRIDNVIVESLTIGDVQAMISFLFDDASLADRGADSEQNGDDEDSRQHLASLAELIHSLTDGGNILFIHQFIRTIHEKRLLYYDTDSSRWECNEGAILESDMLSMGGEKLLGWTVTSLSQRSPEMKEVLQISSCLGSDFAEKHVQLAAIATSQQVRDALQLLLEWRLIIERPKQREDYDVVRYQWSHDQFQQASYTLIPENSRKDYKIDIGLQLLRYLSQIELEEHAFLVANLLLQGPDIFRQDEDVLPDVAALYCLAGTKAAESSAFHVASDYFRAGLTLLKSITNHWDDHYQLSLRLYSCSIEMATCNLEFDEGDGLFDVIMAHTAVVADQLRAYESKMHSLSARQRDHDAIRLGRLVLRKLGERIPRSPATFQVLLEVLRTKQALRNRSADDILGLRPLRNWKKAAAMRVLLLMLPSSIRSRPKLVPLLSSRGVRLTLRFGLSSFSSAVVSGFGMILSHSLGYVDEGNRCARIAFRILEKYSSEWRCRVYLASYGFCIPWKCRVRDCMRPLLSGARSGLLSGDVEMAFVSVACYAFRGLFCGCPLEEHLASVSEYQARFTSLQQRMFQLTTPMQVMSNLLGRAKDERILSGDYLDIRSALRETEKEQDHSSTALILLSECFFAVYSNDFRRAFELIPKLRKAPYQRFDVTVLTQAYFLDGISEVLTARTLSSSSSGKTGCRGRRHLSGSSSRSSSGMFALKKLKSYAKLSPDNTLGKVYFIEAERAILKDDIDLALRKYHLAIDHANKQDVTQEEAFAYERTGIALASKGRTEEALDYFHKAQRLYELWGCPMKVSQMARRISHPTTLVGVLPHRAS